MGDCSEDEEDEVGDCSGDGGGPVREASSVEMPGRVALPEAVWGKLLSAEELPVRKYESCITALILLPEGKDTASYRKHMLLYKRSYKLIVTVIAYLKKRPCHI